MFQDLFVRCIILGQIILAFMLTDEVFNNHFENRCTVIWIVCIQFIFLQVGGVLLSVNNYIEFKLRCKRITMHEGVRNAIIHRRQLLLVINCSCLLTAIILEIIVAGKMCDADIWYTAYLNHIIYFYVSIGLTLFVVLINWIKFCLCHGYNRFDYSNNDVVMYKLSIKDDDNMEKVYTHENQDLRKQNIEINVFYKKLNKFMLNLFMVILLFQLFYNVLHFREIVETSNDNQLTLYASTSSVHVVKDWNNFRNN